LLDVWGVVDLEGFLSRFVASDSLVRKVLSAEKSKGNINTDDRMLIEYGFGRSLGRKNLFSVSEIRSLAQQLGEDRPNLIGAAIDWQRVRRNYVMLHWYSFTKVSLQLDFSRQELPLVMHFNAYLDKNYRSIINAWQKGLWQDQYPLEIAILAESLAETADKNALVMADRLQDYWPGTADAIRTRYYWRTGQEADALRALESAIINLRTYPWNPIVIVSRLLDLCSEIVSSDPKKYGQQVFTMLEQLFAAGILHEHRMVVLIDIARQMDPKMLRNVLEQFEPHFPWGEALLRLRAECYKETGSPLASKAAEDLELFLNQATKPFKRGLLDE
jgi:hypothetical protein